MNRDDWRGSIPSLITLTRIVLLPIVMIAWLRGGRVLAVGVYLGLVLTDGLDGWLARRLDAATQIGAVLDVLVDVTVSLVLLMMFAWTRTVPVWVPIGPVLAALLFLCTSHRGVPRYDPIGKYFGTALFILIGVLLSTSDTQWVQVTSFVIAGLSLIVLINRAVYCAGRR